MTLSVWMIAYNQESHIAQALDSVLEQKTIFDFEIVIGDDFSTDKTRDILLLYKAKYPEKIKLLFHEQNVGMVKNQNLTFAACNGDYIAMLEADDFWNDKNKLQIQYEFMKKYPECDICFHPVNTTEGKILNKHTDEVKIFSTEEIIVGGGYFISTPSIMLKKSITQQLPDFLSNAPAGDYYLQVFGALRGGALFVPKIMSTYRINSKGSWSNSVKNITIKQNFRSKTLEKIIEMDIYLNKKYTSSFQKRYLRIALYLSMDYLYSNNSQKFKETIQKIKNNVNKKNKKFWILFIFKKYPRLLKSISSIHNSIKSSPISKS